jgi:hypothetical protein
MDIVVTRDPNEVMRDMGSPYLRQYHHIIKGHEYAKAVNRETGSDKYFVFYSASSGRYTLGYWLIGPDWYKAEVGRYSGITSWTDQPITLDKVLAQIRNGRGRARRIQEEMDRHFREKEEHERLKAEACIDMGKHYAKKSATMGVRHDPVYEQWKRGEGLDVPITDAEKEKREREVEAYMPKKIMARKE